MMRSLLAAVRRLPIVRPMAFPDEPSRVTNRSTAAASHWGLGGVTWILHRDEDVSIAEEMAAAGTCETPHQHPTGRQVFVILEGEAVMVVEGRRILLHAGDALPVQAGVVHEFRNESSGAVRFLVISYPQREWSRREVAVVRLRPIGSTELGLLDGWERDPDVSRWIQAEPIEVHAARFADPLVEYVGIEHQGSLAGAMILCADRDGRRIELKRIMMARRGEGLGSSALRTLPAYCRQRWKHAVELWLDVFADNARARRVYGLAGWSLFGNTIIAGRDAVFMSLPLADQ